MGLLDNIFGAVLLLSLVIATTLIIAINSNQGMIVDLEFKRMSHEIEKHQLSLNTMMRLTEPASGQSYSRLLARSLSNREDTVMIGTTEYNVTKNVNQALNMVYGPNNWYYEVLPRISEVHIAFVLDGTSSLDSERSILENNINSIVSSVNTSLSEMPLPLLPDLSFSVFITSEDSTKCEMFNTLLIEGFEGCYLVSKTDLYKEYGTIEYSEPLFSVSNVGNMYFDENIYYESDWMGGLVFATETIMSTIIDPADSIIVLFPITDELTTGSVPDECYSSNEPLYTPQSGEDSAQIQERVGLNAGICAFCSDDCPMQRSEQQIVLGLEIIDELKGDASLIMNGIFSEDCNTYYDNAWNYIGLQTPAFSYINDEYGLDRPEGTQTWCDLEGCTGCTVEEPSSGNICWRSSCSRATETQLETISDYYNGQIINLTDIDTLPQEIISNIISGVEKQTRTGGIKDEKRERYVVTYDLLVPGNIVIPFSVWVYAQREFDDSLPEIHSLSADPTPAYSSQDITISVDAYDDSGISTIRIYIEGEEYIMAAANGHYEAIIDTTGLSEGVYDVRYMIVDTQGNILEGTENDVFTIDNNLAPVPDDVVLIFNRESYVIDHNAISTLSFNSVISISSVTINITDTNDNIIHSDNMIKTGSTYDYTQTHNVLDEKGIFYGTIIITDILNRVHVYEKIDNYEVIETMPCTTNSVCSALPSMPYCVGEHQNDFYCSSIRAAEGEYTTQKENCQEGLAYDTLTSECYNPQGIHHIVILPFRFADNNAGKNEFLNFAIKGIDRFMEDSPLSECDSEKIDSTIRFLVSQDMNCIENRGQCNILLINDGNTISSCMTSIKQCAWTEFGSIVDEWHALSKNNNGWEFQGVAYRGQRHYLTALDYSYRQDFNYNIEYDVNVMLHEAGHGWGLNHIDVSNIGSSPANACQPPNAADCLDDPDVKKYYYMNYYNILNKKYGPVGYNYIKTNKNYGLGRVMETCV